MIDQKESAGSRVLNCDLTRAEIFKSLYIQTKGKDHGDGRDLDDEEDLRNLALSSKVAFHDAMKYLWKDVTLHQVNTLYRQETDPERIKFYLNSVRSLTVTDGSVTSTQSGSSPLVDGYQQNRRIFLRYNNEASSPSMWYLEGVRLLHNLENISIRCCPGWPYPPGRLDDTPFNVERTEIHQIDGRAITVHTCLRDIDEWLKWDEPTLRLGEGSSVLDTILVHGAEHPGYGNPSYRSLLLQIQEGNERARRARVRFQTVRGLFLSGKGMFLKMLAGTLEMFPALERFNSEIYNPACFLTDWDVPRAASLCKWLSHGQHALIEASLRGHGVTEETPTLNIDYEEDDFGADLRWLPYFRRCKKLRLPCHIRWVAELGNETLFPEIQIPSVNSLEDLTLEIMDQRVVTPPGVKRVIEFIQHNTTERTRITIRFVYCEDGTLWPVHLRDPADWEQAWEMMANFAKECERKRTCLQS